MDSVSLFCAKLSHTQLTASEQQLLILVSDNMILLSGHSFQPETPMHARCLFLNSNKEKINDIITKLQPVNVSFTNEELRTINESTPAKRHAVIRALMKAKNVVWNTNTLQLIVLGATLYGLSYYFPILSDLWQWVRLYLPNLTDFKDFAIATAISASVIAFQRLFFKPMPVVTF